MPPPNACLARDGTAGDRGVGRALDVKQVLSVVIDSTRAPGTPGILPEAAVTSAKRKFE